MSDTPTDTEPVRGTEAERDTLDTDTMRWVSATVALAGLGLVAYPFLFESTGAAFRNGIIVGTAIYLLGGHNFYRLTKDRPASVAAATLAALFGLWALISPAVIETGSSGLAITTAAGGLITVVLSAYSAYANSKADPTRRDSTRA